LLGYGGSANLKEVQSVAGSTGVSHNQNGRARCPENLLEGGNWGELSGLGKKTHRTRLRLGRWGRTLVKISTPKKRGVEEIHGRTTNG